MHFLQKYKLHLGFFLIVILFFSKCYHFDPEIDDFNESIIPTLSEFRDFYIKNKDSIYGKDVSELKIISLCDIPDELKTKMSQELVSKLCSLEERGKIQRVAFNHNCLNFNIKVYNNSILRTKWLELALVHDGNIDDEILCSNDLFSRAVETKKLKDGWTLILYKAYASWRG